MSDHFTTLRSKGLKSHQIYMKVLKTNLADFSFSSWFQAKFTFNIRQCSTAYLNYVPPPCSLKSPGNHYFKIVVFFRISVFAKWSILELWKGSEYTKTTAVKYLLNIYWWALENVETNIHVFISYTTPVFAFPAFWLKTDIYRVNLSILSECGKLRTR